ncbi:MAG: response regulator [Acidimicrobiales bacterium]
MAEPIRVLIADDHERFRRGLRMVLEAEEGMEVVAEAADGGEAVKRVEELAPDVILMDVRMPNTNGIEATRTIREAFPATRIIMLTVSDDEDDLFDAVKAGANGYLLKEVSIEEVADAVRAVVQGQSLISPSMAAKLISEFGTLARKAEESDPVSRQGPSLSDRELEVLKRVATGMENEAIAVELGISPTAVRNHVANILVKLQLRSRIEAAILAVESRLLDG